MAAPKRAAMPEMVTGYGTDISAWAVEQARHLRTGSWTKLDVEHLADEVEALARTEQHRLMSALRVILLHLLKWDHQPTRRTRSWSTSIRTHRLAVVELLEDSPSLGSKVDTLLARAYRRARIEAAAETKLAERTFPETCPYGFDEVTMREVIWRPATEAS